MIKMHNQLGHPRPDRLAAELSDLKYEKEYSACARNYQCEMCLRRKRPQLFRVAKLHELTHFNHTIDTDAFYLLWHGKKGRVMSIMCEYSLYEVDSKLPQETAEQEIDVLESKWIA